MDDLLSTINSPALRTRQRPQMNYCAAGRCGNTGMTYLIRERDGRWLIYACGACILDCEDEATARATVAAASALIQQSSGNGEAAFTSRPCSAHAPAAATISARFG
jgi:hypothetical protein